MDSLLGAEGVLVRLGRREPQDTDVLCTAVQCVANICMRLALVNFTIIILMIIMLLHDEVCRVCCRN